MEINFFKKKNKCPKWILDELILIHYGATEYKPELVSKIENFWKKPKGGLWTSPISSSFGWKQWCEAEDFRECTGLNSFNLKFKRDSSVLIIDSYEDLSKLPHIDIESRSNDKCLDFELLNNTFDAIWLTENGLYETNNLWSGGFNLYGWDCESILIMNKDSIYQF